MQRPVLEFSDYESIPKAIETYILSRSDARYITEIPLEQINIGIRAEMNHIKTLLGY